jgi:hypothetical protein
MVVNKAGALVLLLLLAAGCSSGSPDSDPKATLLQAARRTLAADSFHIETVATYDGEDHRAELNYVAPDRFDVRSYGKGAAATVSIGRDRYDSDSEDVHRFYVSRSPCDVTIGEFVPALGAILYAKDVRFSRGNYTFTIDGDAEGEARIVEGYIASLTFRWELPHLKEGVVEHHTLSRFGDKDISIEAPPSGQVSPAPGPEDFPDVILVGGSPSSCP